MLRPFTCTVLERFLDECNADGAALQAVVVVLLGHGDNYNRLIDTVVEDRLNLLVLVFVEE